MSLRVASNDKEAKYCHVSVILLFPMTFLSTNKGFEILIALLKEPSDPGRHPCCSVSNLHTLPGVQMDFSATCVCFFQVSFILECVVQNVC